MIMALCINSKNPPPDFPLSKMPVEGQEYPVIKFWTGKLMPHGGVELEGLSLTDCFPYLYHDARRFTYRDTDIDDLLASISKDAELVKEKV